MRRLALCVATLFATVVFADDAVCEAAKPLPIERRLRQLTLDLLGRPPTMAEYRFFQAKGAVAEEDIQAMMGKEEFYGKVKDYHRALLRANLAASVYNNGDSRLLPSPEGVYEVRGNNAGAIRGSIGAGCDHFIVQDDCNASKQDPSLEPAVKTCRDAKNVPLPVSVDYDTRNYTCTAIAGATSCADALSTNKIEAKYEFYCDNRRNSAGALLPFKCLPSAAVNLTTEVLDTQDRVIAFTNPTPLPGQAARLDRCTLTMGNNGIIGKWIPQAGCIQREGTVPVAAPYWMDSPTSMCAVEAQTRLANPYTLETCETGRYLNDRSCGCGERGRRCDEVNTHNVRMAAFAEEPILIADSVIRRDEDYFNILTTRRSFVNGPLSQFYKQKQGVGLWNVTSPQSLDAIPDVPMTQTTTWAEFTRDENASGVLTTPLWLYRFPTQRSRVNQFWNAFMCKHFSPPADAVVPSPEDSCNRENNLSTRCGCSGCHATIEPSGAHWGRYGERNAQFLAPDAFPKLNTKCRDCALAGNTTCDGECGNYVMQAFDGEGASSLGLLRTFLYRTPEEEPNVAGGPKLLVERIMQTGDLEHCAVRNMWNELLGRPMTSVEEGLYMSTLADEFAANGHNMKGLMLRIISTDAYRRID